MLFLLINYFINFNLFLLINIIFILFGLIYISTIKEG